MRTQVRRPLGKNASSKRTLELQSAVTRAAVGRSVGVIFKEGVGGTASCGDGTPGTNTTNNNIVPRWG